MSGTNKIDSLKRRFRRIKRHEASLRAVYGKPNPAGSPLADRWFSTVSGKNVKYPFEMLTIMPDELINAIIEEYYTELYIVLLDVFSKESALFDPELLSALSLPPYADETDIKRRFRELVKLYHPDAGGDADSFIRVRNVYEKLIAKIKPG